MMMICIIGGCIFAGQGKLDLQGMYMISASIWGLAWTITTVKDKKE